MLDEYKELCRAAADYAPGWEKLSKNDLCRAYVANSGDEALQNAYFGAILYRYWNLISKYHSQSANCASPEECYGWLVDSVACCVNLASWQDPNSSIYNDPNGPDKVINRCMKCARLTYYQFINRKKRRDEFGLLSVEELKELYGNGAPEPSDPEQECDISSLMINEYVVDEFRRKNYFVSFLIYFILKGNVFDLVTVDNKKMSEFNLRRICQLLNSIDDATLHAFSEEYELSIEDVKKANEYIKIIPAANMRKKVTQALENLKHSALVESLLGGN